MHHYACVLYVPYSITNHTPCQRAVNRHENVLFRGCSKRLRPINPWLILFPLAWRGPFVLCTFFKIYCNTEKQTVLAPLHLTIQLTQRLIRGAISKRCLVKKKKKKRVKTLDEELVSCMDAAFKTKAPRAIITVSSIPCQVSEDCPIFSFN